MPPYSCSQNHQGLTGYQSLLRAYIHRFVPVPSTVDDLLQDTYLHALQTIRNRGPPERPIPWLLSIARRTTFHYLYHERRYEAESLEDDAVQDDRAVQPLDVLIASEDLHLLRQALPRVPAPDHDLITSHYLRGISCRELAGSYGTTHAAIKTRLYRAREKLRGYLSRNNGNPEAEA